MKLILNGIILSVEWGNLFYVDPLGIISIQQAIIERETIFAAILSQRERFRELPEYEGTVRQQMSLFVLDLQHPVFAQLATELNKLYVQIGEQANFSGAFNSYKAHFYPQGSVGLTAHRDFKKDANLTAILMIAGGGKFYSCRNKQGEGSQEVVAEPGSMILMRAARNSQEQQYRHYHFVADVQEDRYTIVARDERK